MTSGRQVPPSVRVTRTITGDETSVELLRRSRKGDRRALDRLIERHLPAFRAWAAGRLPNWARGVVDTDDLVQETLLHTFRHLHEFRPQYDGALQVYLRRALRNRIRDELRRAQRRGRTIVADLREPDRGPSPLDVAIEDETHRRFETALEQIDRKDREAIVARVELRQSWSEVADVLGKPSAAAARMAVARALTRLAKEMARLH